MTPTQIRDLTLTTSAPSKGALPWLKLAVLGDKRTEKKLLRHDANLREIIGIEVEYDGEKGPFEEAAAIIKGARLKAELYSSPSQSIRKLRWRQASFQVTS